WAQADELFDQDMRTRAEVHVDQYVKVPLNQNQYDALSCFTYNCGAGNLRMLVDASGLNQGKYEEVPKHIVLYNKARNQEGAFVVLPGLTTRRNLEAELFETPVQ